MHERLRHSKIALPGLAVIATALALTACSGPSTGPPPSVNFGASGGASVGMPGMSVMPQHPAPASQTGSLAPAAGTPQTGGATAPEVSITNFAFAPATLTVKRGDTVTWANHDEEPHTIVAGDGSFHSPGMDTNATYSYTFNTPGSFDYVCSIHPFMRGTVVVTS
jgi:amicyanin